MPNVQMPDGKVIQFPDDMSVEDMKSASALYVQKTQPVEPKTDWWRGAAQATGSALGGIAAGAVTIPNPIPGDEVVAIPAAMAMGDAMGGQAYDYVRGLLYPETMPSVGESFDRAATDMAFDLAGGKVAETAVRAGAAALSPIKTVIKKKVGPVGASSVRDVAGLQRHGFKPEIGMLDNPEAQSFSASMRGKPATGSVFGEVDAHNYARGQEINQEIADSLGPNKTPYDIGELMHRDAALTWEQWHQVNDDLWSRVGSYVPSDGGVPAANVIAKAQEVLEAAKQSPYAADAMAPAVKQAKLILKSVDEAGNISKAALDSIKKAARGSYKKLSHEADDLDRLRMAFERAADSDLGAAAEVYGGDAARKARGMAKDWYKRGMGNKKVGDVGLLDEVSTILKNPEPGAIYNRLMQGGKPAVDRLMRTLNMVSAETASAIRSRAYRDLGLATPGRQNAAGDAFSFSTFLTNYAKMQQKTPGAADVLFGPAKGEMDTLLQHADFFRSLDKYANSSQTAVNTAWDELWKPIMQTGSQWGAGGLVGGMGSAEGLLLGTAAGAAQVGGRLFVQRRIARLMTDPEFVKWLAGGTRVLTVQSAVKPNVYGRLAAIALNRMNNPETEQQGEDMLWYLDEIKKNREDKE